MIRRPPRSTLDRSSAASDVYKRQQLFYKTSTQDWKIISNGSYSNYKQFTINYSSTIETNSAFTISTNGGKLIKGQSATVNAVSYTHLRAHETVLDLVCRLLLEKQKTQKKKRKKMSLINN